ncbi:MAG TPA: hypothetical protein VFL03_11425 [Candidatus Limnocylindrales bacterium]|nr:hypothetical protein [Candidatus Limnocylindrales bacterium]
MHFNPMAAGRRGRVATAALTALVAMLVAWSPVLASVGWGSLYRASNENADSVGNALARTVTSGGTAYLHQLSVQWVVGGEDVSDSGPYLGIYYRRGNSSASSWSTAKRLNSSSKHGAYPTVASSSKYVYAAWRAQPHPGVDDWNGVDPRPLQFRRNTNHGSGSYWKSQPSFLGADRIDRPSIAATGARVWIAYTDAVGGEIRLQKSTDYGATFQLKSAIGATTSTYEGGYSGHPVVAATGSTVAVAFFNGSSWRVKISTDAGSSWTVDTDLAGGDIKKVDVAAASGKVGFAWLSGDQHIYLRRFNGTTLGSQRTVVAISNTTTYKNINHIALAMTGTSVLGVAYNACNTTGCTVDSTHGSSIRWTESRDSGVHWTSSKTIGSYATKASRRNNEWPSVVWAGSSKRIVSWNAFGTSDAYPERIVVRVGTGTP